MRSFGESVTLHVACGNALEWPTDVLVLKYAQGLYGVDRAAVRCMGGPTQDLLPLVGRHLLVRSPQELPARAVLFLGVPPLSDFTYRDIREFGHRALSVVFDEGLPAREVCLTLHGPNFGLDEVEAFRAEVAGILDALRTSRVGPELERVTFIERDAARARLMVTMLDELVSAPHGGHPVSGNFERRWQAVERQLGSVGFDSSGRPHAFVAMPFGGEFNDVYHYGILQPVRQAGMLCERMDRSAFTGDIVDRMKTMIKTARVVVADISSANPNVYLEIGFAWAVGVPTILLCDQSTEPHFDVRGHRYLRYRSIREVEEQLGVELGALQTRT